MASPQGTSYLAQHLSRHAHPHHHQHQRLLTTDRDGYLRHLEAQLGRVEEACAIAHAVSERQEELGAGLAALRRLEGERAAAWVEGEEARAREVQGVRDLRRRVEGLEALGDR